ncbi:hypothetical protein NDU88_002989 [Pleurodeles waltl]|uniref:Retrotransposon gag domain-containing protein n=1 Tax=Pleurodeles waltl TaxID=8319 RepID=A0AAV7UD24_PLEWA|nr:hypothetical protein NDU88_002989 [Pleurodeles waltl]
MGPDGLLAHPCCSAIKQVAEEKEILGHWAGLRVSGASGRRMHEEAKDQFSVGIMQSVTPPPFFLTTPGEPLIKWSKWKKTFLHYARVCGSNLTNERKTALLMHCLGCEGQEIFESLPDPGEDATDLNEFELCLKKLDLHYLPKVSTILERYHFGMREQRQGESIEEYVTALRKLASTCKFGSTIEERIRDQFMLRCASDKIRQELWSKDDPTLHEVIILAKGVEHTLACVEELEKQRKVEVNKIVMKGESAKGNVAQREKEKIDQTVENRYKNTRCFRYLLVAMFLDRFECLLVRFSLPHSSPQFRLLIVPFELFRVRDGLHSHSFCLALV